MAGADDFVSIAEYGRKKRKWLGQFLNLGTGIPSHDRFNAVLGAIKPHEFEKCLLSWMDHRPARDRPRTSRSHRRRSSMSRRITCWP
jgi:hypothetical protein